jgi:chaperone required for assembly of F1-ATPase
MAENYSKTLLYKALKDKYTAIVSEAEATLEIYFKNSVGIGEHPQQVEEMDKLINKISEAEDNLCTLHLFFGETGESDDDKGDVKTG